jgi:hypothetical protein
MEENPPWNIVLRRKLIVGQTVKKSPNFNITRKFFNVFPALTPVNLSILEPINLVHKFPPYLFKL